MNLKDIILTDEQSRSIWDRVYNEFDFKPNSKDNSHSFDTPLPFKIKKEYMVYSIENMTEKQIDKMDLILKKCFSELTAEGRKMYALDWQHTSFIYDPKIEPEQEIQWKNGQFISDERYSGGGYMAYYPSFYPDGDYYFFIEENFEFGLLGHPWRREIWIFGTELIQKVSPYTESIGLSELKRAMR